MRATILSIIAGSLLFTNVWADHEPDHRYNIRGYVLDGSQRGIDNITVQAFAEGKSLGDSKTNADGYYSMHLHLHDEDFHRILKLQAGPHEAELRVTFERGDDTSARIHEANFVDGKYVEGALERFRIPDWSYAAGGLVLFMTIMVLLEKHRKKKIRLAKFGTHEKHSPSGHKAKKARRKKH
jgi:hypothetical protein